MGLYGGCELGNWWLDWGVCCAVPFLYRTLLFHIWCLVPVITLKVVVCILFVCFFLSFCEFPYLLSMTFVEVSPVCSRGVHGKGYLIDSSICLLWKWKLCWCKFGAHWYIIIWNCLCDHICVFNIHMLQFYLILSSNVHVLVLVFWCQCKSYWRNSCRYITDLKRCNTLQQ